MSTAIILLILLLSTRRILAIVFPNCPYECECEKTASEFKENFTVYCYKGGLNDTHFSNILEIIPSSVGVLGRWKIV